MNAVKKHWGNMPLQTLMARLNEKTGNKVLRIDDDVIPEALPGKVEASDPPGLYYEISF